MSVAIAVKRTVAAADMVCDRAGQPPTFCVDI
jgi:hypothetical protein